MNLKPFVRAMMAASLMAMLGYMVYLGKISGDVLVAIASTAIGFYFGEKDV